MRILFTTSRFNAPSTILNLELLKGLEEIEGVEFEVNAHSAYAGYDVILFMGYDAEILCARDENPTALLGVIDPRPSFSRQPLQADFILANGIEMKDWYSKFCANIFIYPIYPKIDVEPKLHSSSEKVVIGYHGNGIHLAGMARRITPAIERLSEDMDVEFLAMYDIASLGRVKRGLSSAKNVQVNHIQWSESGYLEYMSKVDVGVVPNTIPVKRESLVKKIGSSFRSSMNEHASDYLLRYKVTSNAGRALVFAQCGVPVIADMSPSALQLFEDEVDGYICHSTNSWYQVLKKLACNPDLRNIVGMRMLEKFAIRYSSKVLNRKLVDFLVDVKKESLEHMK